MKPFLDHFSLLAPFYESIIRPKNPEKIGALAHLPAGGIVLDAGGGTGRVAQYFRARAAQILVADESLQMLREAQKKDGLQPVVSYAEDLPFQDGSFDCVIMVDALHHVADQRKTTDELWRILKPGGCLIIEEPNIHLTRVKFIALAEKLMLMRSHFLTPQQIIALFQGKPAVTRLELEDAFAWVIVEK
ncbi:MAG: class I SAM-dependent methyltransferase [Anaerolineaceae bacterium]|nr:class I SAM-dependent methyltransferase [Anaerolineaceae bacterium]